MDIKETKIYKFIIPAEEITFNFEMPGESKEEAVDKLKRCLSTVLAELQMEFPNKLKSK